MGSDPGARQVLQTLHSLSGVGPPGKGVYCLTPEQAFILVLQVFIICVTMCFFMCLAIHHFISS